MGAPSRTPMSSSNVKSSCSGSDTESIRLNPHHHDSLSWCVSAAGRRKRLPSERHTTTSDQSMLIHTQTHKHINTNTQTQTITQNKHTQSHTHTQIHKHMHAQKILAQMKILHIHNFFLTNTNTGFIVFIMVMAHCITSASRIIRKAVEKASLGSVVLTG